MEKSYAADSGKSKPGHVMRRRSLLSGIGGAAAAAGFRSRPAKAASTVRMWCFLDPVNGKSSREKVLKMLIDEFEAANPGVSVVVEPQNWQTMTTKFMAAHQTGSAPDITTINSARVRAAIKGGTLANLDSLFAGKWSAEEKDDIDSPVWRLGATADAHYQISISTAIFGMVYRRDLYKKAGIDPDSLTTWDAFIQAMGKLGEKDGSGNITRWGFGQSNTGVSPLPPILLNVLLDKQGTLFDKNFRAMWSTPAGVQGLQMEVDMVRKYQIMPQATVNMDVEALYEFFRSGRLAVERVNTARWLQEVAVFGEGNIGYMPNPSFTEGKTSPSEINVWHVAVWSGSKNQENAGKFVEHLASKRGDYLWATVGGQLPNRKSTIIEHPEFFKNPNNSILVKSAEDVRKSAWIQPEEAGDSGWDEGFNAAFQDVMINNMDPKAALEKAEAAFNRANRR